ncbi:hypothetical protein EVAR_18662_1 [Eumeta japonica]|uniref:Uncharacterized protein n=1 Tax=Eumeta variegata TaxID=151549 RepID=A0A4C1U6R9_EUMVA|nr:hypothetical protein EVAR_18662_1 [Eumeta japonica]
MPLESERSPSLVDTRGPRVRSFHETRRSLLGTPLVVYIDHSKPHRMRQRITYENERNNSDTPASPSLTTRRGRRRRPARPEAPEGRNPWLMCVMFLDNSCGPEMIDCGVRDENSVSPSGDVENFDRLTATSTKGKSGKASESKWSPPLRDARNSGGIASAWLASWKARISNEGGKGKDDGEGKGSGPPELLLTVENAIAEARVLAVRELFRSGSSHNPQAALEDAWRCRAAYADSALTSLGI